VADVRAPCFTIRGLFALADEAVYGRNAEAHRFARTPCP
jgi:hypothetical protein